jgi:hypothetical protein
LEAKGIKFPRKVRGLRKYGYLRESLAAICCFHAIHHLIPSQKTQNVLVRFLPFFSPSLLFKIPHPLSETLKMLGATLIESKDGREEEHCSLGKASNRLVPPTSLHHFFYSQSHPPIPPVSFKYPKKFGF